MKKENWILAGLAAAVVVVVLAWSWKDRADKAEAKETEAMVEALLEQEPYAEYDWQGNKYVIARRNGESAEEFRRRCEGIVFLGEENLGPCWESDCVRLVPPQGPYHVKLCAPDQATLDEMVADYCADPSHDCDNCP